MLYIANEHFVKSHKLCHTWFSLNSQYSILILRTIQFGAQVGRLTVAKQYIVCIYWHDWFAHNRIRLIKLTKNEGKKIKMVIEFTTGHAHFVLF